MRARDAVAISVGLHVAAFVGLRAPQDARAAPGAPTIEIEIAPSRGGVGLADASRLDDDLAGVVPLVPSASPGHVRSRVIDRPPRAAVPPPALRSVGSGIGPPGVVASLGRGTNLCGVVQERIAGVAALVGHRDAARISREAVAVVEFATDADGYVRELEVEASTGDPRLDADIFPILHLAEPYPAESARFRVRLAFSAGGHTQRISVEEVR